MRITDAELDAVAGGTDVGGNAGVKGFTNAEIDAVVGGGDVGGNAGVKG